MTCSSVAVGMTLKYVEEQKGEAELLELYHVLVKVCS